MVLGRDMQPGRCRETGSLGGVNFPDTEVGAGAQGPRKEHMFCVAGGGQWGGVRGVGWTSSSG